ncbi:MAG: hypothetical protein LBM76_03000 [Mycoplasmataceae bacterium]|jgi:hypothetical protein|nr:hypothetical protein [Mycoplasmataceae bacterium]
MIKIIKCKAKPELNGLVIEVAKITGVRKNKNSLSKDDRLALIELRDILVSLGKRMDNLDTRCDRLVETKKIKKLKN